MDLCVLYDVLLFFSSYIFAWTEDPKGNNETIKKCLHIYILALKIFAKHGSI